MATLWRPSLATATHLILSSSAHPLTNPHLRLSNPILSHCPQHLAQQHSMAHGRGLIRLTKQRVASGKISFDPAFSNQQFTRTAHSHEHAGPPRARHRTGDPAAPPPAAAPPRAGCSGGPEPSPPYHLLPALQSRRVPTKRTSVERAGRAGRGLCGCGIVFIDCSFLVSLAALKLLVCAWRSSITWSTPTVLLKDITAQFFLLLDHSNTRHHNERLCVGRWIIHIEVDKGDECRV